jgi:glycosyltransferase involved in cell wall biosynthesis
MPLSISLVILCLNEESGLKPTYDSYKKQFIELNIDYEIIIVNDGSTDKSAQIAEDIEQNDKNTTVLTNDQTMGMGYGYKRGLTKASKEYYMFAGGYSALSEQDIKRLIDRIQENDLVLAYVKQQRMRQPLRRVLSKCFTFLMNSITGLELRYYNAMVIARTSPLKQLHIRSNSYMYCAEFVTKLIKIQKCRYCEVPVTVSFNKKAKKKFKIVSNFLQTFKFFIFLFYDIYLARPNKTTENI